MGRGMHMGRGGCVERGVRDAHGEGRDMCGRRICVSNPYMPQQLEQFTMGGSMSHTLENLAV